MWAFLSCNAASLLLHQMACRCSPSKGCCTTQHREPGAGRTARPSTTPSMPSKWETTSSPRRLRKRRTTAEPLSAEPKNWTEWQRHWDNSQVLEFWWAANETARVNPQRPLHQSYVIGESSFSLCALLIQLYIAAWNALWSMSKATTVESWIFIWPPLWQ